MAMPARHFPIGKPMHSLRAALCKPRKARLTIRAGRQLPWAWAGTLSVLLMLSVSFAGGIVERAEHGRIASLAKVRLVDLAIKALLWFELGEPTSMALIFIATALAGGALAFAALSTSHRIGSRRISYWSVPIPIAFLCAAIMLVSLRSLMAIVADAAGLLCPPPWNCGAADGLFGKYDDYAFFATGLAAAAAGVYFVRKRIARRE
jgi:hypothetical protein